MDLTLTLDTFILGALLAVFLEMRADVRKAASQLQTHDFQINQHGKHIAGIREQVKRLLLWQRKQKVSTKTAN